MAAFNRSNESNQLAFAAQGNHRAALLWWRDQRALKTWVEAAVLVWRAGMNAVCHILKMIAGYAYICCANGTFGFKNQRWPQTPSATLSLTLSQKSVTCPRVTAT